MSKGRNNELKSTQIGKISISLCPHIPLFQAYVHIISLLYNKLPNYMQNKLEETITKLIYISYGIFCLKTYMVKLLPTLKNMLRQTNGHP